jgi:hypothetical protein
MSTPTGPKRNGWLFLAFILWGIAPAILMVIGTVGRSVGGLEQLSILGLFGMPLILYAWSVSFLQWLGNDRLSAYGFGILLAVLMCVVNLVLGAAGCSMLAGSPQF